MSQICKELEVAGYELRLASRDGINCVEAKRTATATIDLRAAGKLLLDLARSQDEALVYVRPTLAQRLAAIEATIKCGVNEADEAHAIYEFNALLFGGDGKSSDGYTWEALVKGVK